MKRVANHYFTMSILMIVAGLLSTMNVWADSIAHVHFSLNDLYMVTLMTGWMITFMAFIDANYVFIAIGLIVVAFSILCIRSQLFITEKQFLLGMIPHHSMAILMSKRLLQKENTIPELLKSIVKTQTAEIGYMKKHLNLI